MNQQQEGRLIECVENISTKVDKLDETIHGNGREGLIIETDRNTMFIRGLKKTAIVIAGLGLTAVGIVVAIIALF